MYVFLIPAQGVGQNIHRLVKRDVPEIQKKKVLQKHCMDFEDNWAVLDTKKRKCLKYSLEHFDPDEEDVKAKYPGWIICQLKYNNNTLLT